MYIMARVDSAQSDMGTVEQGLASGMLYTHCRHAHSA